MAIDFSTINLEVIDININSAPEIYIKQSGVTLSKHVLEDMNYPQNVQYCTGGNNNIFAIRASKSNEAKSTPFSKTKNDQASTRSCNNKNLLEALVILIPNYQPNNRYKVIGEFNTENRGHVLLHVHG
ncbi:hypothetical protein [Propionispira raffinosivorans]|uniref:hypothetical protein n=1 Tax=Propionispira raffinosivorans TaxID=86959 RepID=UPI001B7FAADD|nr:hypothetical protein [Propionispira raffinosivorans]